MVQETAAPVETPVSTPVETPVTPAEEPTVETPVEAPAETPELAAESTEPIGPVTWDDYVAKDENLRTAADLKLNEVREESRREAQRDLQPRIDRMNQTATQYHQSARAVESALTEIRDQLKEASESGAIDATDLRKVLNSSPQAFAALANLTSTAAQFNTMRWVVAEEGKKLGSSDFTGEFISRWNNAEGGAEQWEEVYTDMVKARDAALVEKSTKPLRERIRVLEAQIEGRKAQVREGAGPSATTGSAGRGGINSLAEAERRYNLPSGHPEKIDHGQFKEAASRFGAKYV